MKPGLTIKEAAEVMGVTEQYLRISLQRGTLPFGSATIMKKGGKIYRYHIPSKGVYKYMGLE